MKPKRLNTPIFVYDDYVDFLDSWYRYAKRFGFTQREFNKRAGIKAKAFFSDILARRKKLGKSHIDGFIIGLELSAKEAEYFELLVLKEITTDMNAKVGIYQRLAFLREKNLSAIVVNGTSEYFSSWKYPLILEYFRSKKKVSSLDEISRACMNLKLSIPEIRVAIDKLQLWNLLSWNENTGVYTIVNDRKTITYEEIPHMVVNDVKRTMIESSIHALENLDKNERHISLSIRGLSFDAYRRFCEKIDMLRKEFLENPDENPADNVYALNIQVFPVMKIGKDPDQGAEKK